MTAGPPRRAVIIGVDDYGDSSIPNLTGAANDASDMRERLTTSGGFEIANNHFLLNQDASSLRIRQAISDLLWKTAESEFSILYFSGHGLTDAYGNGFIAPQDMVKSDPLVHGIRMQELRELTQAAKNKKTVLLILDCCYSGIASGDKAVDLPGAAVQKCLAPLSESPGSGRLIFTSAGSDERSREVATCQHRLEKNDPHPHGAFTYRIIEGLDGQASAEGHRVTLGALLKFVDSAFAGDDEHKPRLYGSDVNTLDGIFLCLASRQEELDKQVNEVRRLLAHEDDLYALFRAINGLESILRLAPDLDAAFELRDLIDRRLAPLLDPASGYLFDNMLRLSVRCGETVDRLQGAVCREQITFETITAEDLKVRILILSLFRATRGHIPLEVLQNQLVAFQGRSSQGLHPPPDVGPSME
jgi:hypothetical protein